MTSCTGRLGDALDLMIADGFHLVVGLPIWGPNPPKDYVGTYRVSVESHGSPQ